MAEAQLTEEWRPVVGFEEIYSASSLGRIRRDCLNYPKFCGLIKKPKIHPQTGYAQVGMRIPSKKQQAKYIHRVVYEAFHGPIPPGIEINHKNFIKTDNRIDNLEATTPWENTRHAAINGRMAKKLSSGIALAIRVRHAYGQSQYSLAKEYGVNHTMIGRIVRGSAWSY